MRVAIEASSLGLTSGGLARYTGELSLALARGFPDDEFYLVSDQPFRMPEGGPPNFRRGGGPRNAKERRGGRNWRGGWARGSPADDFSLVWAPPFRMPEGGPPNLRRGGGPRNAMERRWWIWGLAREMNRLGADLVHGPDFAVPYIPRRPSVLTIHDLSPWMKPRWHHAAERVRRRTPVLLELGIATMIVTPGEGGRKEAIERFHLRPGRVVAVPEAAAPWLRPVETGGGAPYFLFVGTLEPRKNLETLVEAWREVRRRHPIDLVLAGRRRKDSPDIEEEPGLRLGGEVPDAELAGVYSGALAFVYPSLYEGFGRSEERRVGKEGRCRWA